MSEEGGTSATSAFASLALILGGPLLCFYYVSCERTFYWWDYAIYHDISRAASEAFGTSVASGLRYVRGTLDADYNAIFTLPLLPFLGVFGVQRAVYLTAVYLVYHLPLLYVAGLILKQLSPQKGWGVWLGAAIAFLSPAYWRALLRGYPDTVGAMLLGVATLLHIRRQTSQWRWRESAIIGVALGMSVVLRRHYAYGALVFFAAVGLDVLWQSFVGSQAPVRARTRELGQRVLHALLAAAVSVGVVVVLIPSFGRRALEIASKGLYASWESSAFVTARSVLETVGAVAVLLGLTGGILHWRSHPESRPALRFLALLTVIWLCVWVFVVRQAAYHYPHVLPLAVSVGIGALFLRIAEEPRPLRRRLGSLAVGAAVFVTLCHPAGNVGAFARLDRLPRGTLPNAFRPLQESGYQEQRELVMYLRQLSEHKPARIVVGASSVRLNFDLLRNAEATLYRRSTIKFLPTPQADSMGTLPTSALLAADYVVVATPFQHHLLPHEQKVVRVVVDIFQEHWEIADDFELLPRTFELAAPLKVQVWKRLRETNADVAYRTDVRIARYVSGRAPSSRLWQVLTSKFDASSAVNPDGTTKVKAHPAKADTSEQTTLQTAPIRGGVGTISGVVYFYDERCVGAELVVTSDAPDAEVKSLGVFTPKQGRSPFRSPLTTTDEQAIRLLVRSAPGHRQEIDFCTLGIDDLQILESAQ